MLHNREIPCLTGARFIAALLVVIFHRGWLQPLPEFLFLFGRQAVSFFFILSGVVLTYSYYKSINSGNMGWWEFFNLRLSRIAPMYIATWLLATVYVWYGLKPAQDNQPFVSWIIGLFCLQGYWPSADIIFKWNGVAWSISCEMFFYALFPFLLVALGRRLRSTRAIVTTMVGVYLLEVILYSCASSVLAGLITPDHSFLGYQPRSPESVIPETITVALMVFPPLRLAEFVIGMCIGLLMVRHQTLVRSALRANLLLGFCAVALVSLVKLPAPTWFPVGVETYLLFIPVLTLILVALASGLTILTPVLESRPAILLGNASYALYLVHPFLSPASHPFLPPDANPTRLVYILYVIGDVVAAVAFYLLLERPARRLWRQVFRKRSEFSARASAKRIAAA
jgi:peptidoglycan/LPS O-acetylase OafA/YrhL